jgi:peptidoglycan/LPS O-acetylase OafA/YrhL
MGTLRFLLAITVVLNHSLGNYFVGAENAVQIFFILSGFLISWIIVKNKYQSKKLFYINRFLRIYPIYLVVLFVQIIVYFISKEQVLALSVIQASPFFAKCLLVISNFTILFQDLTLFLSINDSRLFFTSDFTKSDILLTYGLLNPPAWSLSLEILFYIIAPFILKRPKAIFALFLLSILIRFFLINLGIGTKDPWTYRFFPSEISMFLLGSISYYLFYKYIRFDFSKLFIRYFTRITTVIIIMYCLSYDSLPYSELSKSRVLFILIFLSLPCLFIFQSSFNFDQYLGKISYPIYICHWSIITLLSNFSIIQDLDPFSRTFVILTFTVLYSIVLFHIVDKPIDKLRIRIKIKN